MSGGSIGSILGGILGFALAPFTGGASLLVTTGLMAAGRLVGGLLDPPPAQQITGPRLTDLGQQTATYGAFIPRVYGKIAVMGNVFWIENNKLKEVATTQSQGGKGGPPEVNTTTYKYYGTFAVGLCEGLDPALYGTGAELILSKLWIGEKLFYNRSSNDDETILTSMDKETKFKFYSGTDTQLPEPRMEADLGVANTPAYRGLAYLVIYDMDVEAYGNTIAGVQIKAEIISNGSYNLTPSHKQRFNIDRATNRAATYKDYVLTTATNSKLIIYDVSNLSNIKQVYSGTTLIGQTSITVNGSYSYITTSTGKILIHDLTNPSSPTLVNTVTTASGTQALAIKDNYACVVCNTGAVFQIYDISNPALVPLVGSVSISSSCTSVVIKDNYAVVGTSAATEMVVIDISNKSSPVSVGSLTGSSSIRWLAVVGDYIYATCAINQKINVYSIANPSSPVLVNVVLGGDTPNTSIVIGDGYAYVLRSNGFGIYNISNTALPVLVSTVNEGVNQTQWLAISEDKRKLFFIHSDVITSNPGGLHSYLVVKTIVENSLQLSQIVSSENQHSNLLDPADLDVSLLTQTVRGYRISSVGSIRGGVEPLQAAWPFDVVQDGYKIKYVPRGGANVATISSDKLDARGDNASPGIQISNGREMESQLPAKVSIKYMDINRAYNTGEQYYERINTDAVNHSDLEMPIVFNAQEAAGKAQTLVYLYWLERYDISFKLPPEYLQLQPSDVITITTPDASYNLRLKQINYTQDGRLECQAKYNNAAIYSPSALGEEGLPPDDTLSPPGTTTYELLDIPCLQDIYNVSGFPVAMTGAKKGWPGGVLARSDDGGASYVTVGAVPSPGTVMGLATNTIGAHNGLLLDKASVLNVTLTKGSLSSVSELQMFNGANHFAYGIDGRWEIIAAQNCVLQGDGSYKLSDLMRGRFGTEIYTGTHAVNDNVIYLASAAMLFQTLNSSAIGLTRHYKGVNFQSTLDTATARTFIYNGVNLECLSPVYLNGNRHPTTNDWTLTWIRRGRINNEWKDLIDVPVGETSESYDLEVYSSSAYTTLKRTFTALSSATATYTSAQQVTDFGSNQATLFVKIYQNSATVGRGYPLTTSITR